MAIQEATEAQKQQADISLKDCMKSLAQQANQLAAEQMVKAKEAIDKATQALAQLPEKAIGSLNEAITMLLNIVNGHVNTTSSKFNAETIIAQLEALLNPVIKALSSLPIPAIPGLTLIKQILKALKALIASLSSSGTEQNLYMSTAEIPPELMDLLRDLLSAIQSLCTTLPLVLINLVFQMLNCIISLFKQIAGILGVPSIPYPLNLVPKCIEMMPDIMAFILQVPGKLFDAMYGTLKRAFGSITDLNFPEMPDKIELPKLYVPCPLRSNSKVLSSTPDTTLAEETPSNLIKWNAALQEAGIDSNATAQEDLPEPEIDDSFGVL